MLMPEIRHSWGFFLKNVKKWYKVVESGMKFYMFV
jgi:N6-adenosine-specific RNA methylase IME4